MSRANGELGEFLRTRRSLVRPEQVDLIPGARRQVPGLRREEVATLAGVSTDYYVQLEQGRQGRPSAQVLDALARVLGLDADARGHLRALAGHPAAPGSVPASGDRRHLLVDLIDHGVTAPAMLVTSWMDVVARNPAADALYDGLGLRDNLARMAFLDPDVADLVPDTDHLTRCTVATLRAAAGPEPHGAQMSALVAELTRRSERFARLWDRHDVHRKGSAVKHFHHALAGPLTLHQHVMSLPGDPDLQMWLYQAEPGSPSEEALQRLATGAVTSRS